MAPQQFAELTSNDVVDVHKPAAFINPLTGKEVDSDNVDRLIDVYEQLKAKADEYYAGVNAIKALLARKTTGDAKTRRVEGKRRVAKLEFPSGKFEQSVLKDI